MNGIARVIALIWIVVAIVVLGEAVLHVVQGTSDARSQVLRVLSSLLLLLLAAALAWRFRGWRFMAVLIAILVALREYAMLAVPLDLVLTTDVVLAVGVLILSGCTLTLGLFGFRREG